MTDKTDSSENATLPKEIDLSTYNRIDLSFTNGDGEELLNIAFRREHVENSTEFYVNVIGPDGEPGTVLTLLDLET